MNRKNRPSYFGSDFTSAFSGPGELEEVTALAQKKVITSIIEERLRELKMSKSELARKMKTSRPVVDRLLDESNPGLTLTTLVSAAKVLGLNVLITMDERRSRAA